MQIKINMADKTTFGKSTLEVSPITLGGNVFGWTIDEKQSLHLLDAFADAGFNSVDTADVYSGWVPGNQGGESETIIGKWLKQHGRREELVITTKVGYDLGHGKKGLSASHIKEAAEASLKRLQTDYIDLYLAHADDEETEVGETIEAFNQLITEGKVRYIGASNLPADRITASLQYARKNNLKEYVSLQPLYNLYDRESFEKEYLQLVLEEELAVTSYYALASGFLTGKYRSADDFGKSARGEGMKKYLNERGFRILAALDNISKDTGAPLSQIALAWQLHKPYITSPIASATSDKQLADLIAAAHLELTEDQVNLLDEASAVV